MARIDSRLLFLTTSPRSPEKMLPEIQLLIEHFEGSIWNTETQRSYMELLREADFFNGKGNNDPAFSARDRINRAPKSLGFVTLTPTITLTPAGKALLSASRFEEVLLRQLLKFQIPSPYHKPTNKAANFYVRPYLELLRLVRTMGSLRFDELQIFGMQLTDYRLFEQIVEKIKAFRKERVCHEGSYRLFRAEVFERELRSIYAQRIAKGDIKTRERQEVDLRKFLNTQAGNMRDYADAAFRYLRATGLVVVSHVGKSLSIVPERISEVDFILDTVDRNPIHIDDETAYIEQLTNDSFPHLLTDNREVILLRLRTEFGLKNIDSHLPLLRLKDILIEQEKVQKQRNLNEAIVAIKDYRQYDDIQHTFELIKRKELYDLPLMLEWNMWRAMTMLDGGDIRANLHFDDFGRPMSTAVGNVSDIVCYYEDFLLSVEVTLASGQRQYEMEGEPVMRHLGRLRKSTHLPCYGLFVAPVINEACIAYFYALHRLNLEIYGGTLTIVPLPLSLFQKMLEDSYRADYIPQSTHVRAFFEHSNTIANEAKSEKDWYQQITTCALNWLD